MTDRPPTSPDEHLTSHAMVALRVIGASGLLCVVGCASLCPTSAPPPPKDPAHMTASASDIRLPLPHLSAEQALDRLLELVVTIHSATEINATRLHDAFGVEFRDVDGRLGFSEPVSSQWWSSLEWDPTRTLGPQFSLSFLSATGERPASASGLCAIDFDQLADRLSSAGFDHETYRGERDRVIHERFRRAGLTVTVYTRGESDESPEKIRHACVERVLVQ